MKYVVALDQGTTSSRAILIDSEGNLISIKQKEFNQIFPKQGWVEHDPIEILETQLEVFNQLLTENNVNASDIISLGITNQRETVLLWDRRTGKPLYNAIVWQDKRTSDICQKMKEDGLETYVKKNTGLVIDSYFSGTKIKWIMDNVEGVKSKIKYVSDPENDLFKITSSQASTLSKSWINMIQSSTPSEIGFEKPEDYVKYRVESYGFLYDGINRLEKYITDHRNDNDLYLAWQPKISGKHNKRDILFIIGTEIDLTNKVFNVNTIVQSPIWKGSHQIDTIELKKALDIVNRKANCTDINFEPLKDKVMGPNHSVLKTKENILFWKKGSSEIIQTELNFTNKSILNINNPINSLSFGLGGEIFIGTNNGVKTLSNEKAFVQKINNYDGSNFFSIIDNKYVNIKDNTVELGYINSENSSFFKKEYPHNFSNKNFPNGSTDGKIINPLLLSIVSFGTKSKKPSPPL